MSGSNELARQNNWFRRGKVYKAKTFEALGELYAPTLPGTEPKGISKSQGKRTNAQKPSGTVHAKDKAKETKKEHNPV
jgi:hypothetical protein